MTQNQLEEPGQKPRIDGEVRPECMLMLELLPPYSMDDVHRAYKSMALKLHPDRGGSQSQFVQLQEAYSQAQDFVRFTEGRRNWMAAQVEPYLRMQEILGETESRGGTVVTETLDWMTRSFGDFATLSDRIRAIHYSQRDDGDSFLQYLGQNSRSLQFLLELDLAGTRLTSAGFSRIPMLRSLHHLRLTGTGVSMKELQKILKLPELKSVTLGQSDLSWWERLKLAWGKKEVALKFEQPTHS